MLADFGGPLISQPIAPHFVIVDNLLAEAEYELVHADPRTTQGYAHGWTDGPPEAAAEGEPEAETFSPLDRLMADLEGISAERGRCAIAALVPSQSWAESAWRLSMLALAEEDPDDRRDEREQETGADPILQQVSERAPFSVHVAPPGGAADSFTLPFLGAVSAGEVVLRGR